VPTSVFFSQGIASRSVKPDVRAKRVRKAVEGPFYGHFSNNGNTYPDVEKQVARCPYKTPKLLFSGFAGGRFD